MESVRTLLLICIMVAYPFFVGSIMCTPVKAKAEKKTLGEVYVYGCLVCGAVFGVLSFVVLRAGGAFPLFEKTMLSVSVVLFLCAVVVMAISRKCRMFLCELMKEKISGWSRWDTLCAVAYGVVALLYTSHPFYISDSFSIPEQVLMVLDSGQMGEVQDKPALLYACLCDWFGLGVYRVLFDAVPYVMLLVVFCVMAQLATACFGKEKHAIAYFLVFYALLILFGNEAYMNPPYGLLHYPYEGMVFFSNVCIPLLLIVFLTRGKELYLPLVLIHGIVSAGPAVGGVILGAEILLLILRSLIFSFFERRKAR
ncbi:MAG: hypothetical protein IJ429_02205 [Lachnospiraceae bacterium]|nr:hypothetical protein [Lachnospiraceae bacterium]